MLAQASVETCSASASAANQAFVNDAQTTMAAWKVQRLYYPNEFSGILDGLIDLVSKTSETMYEAAGQATDAGIGAEYKAQWQVLRDLFEQPDLTHPVTLHTYIDAYRAAVNQGKKAIDAPEFKAFVQKVLLECAKGLWMNEFVKCRKTLSAKFLELYRALAQLALRVIRAVYDIIKNAVEAVVQAAKDIYHVASSTVAVLGMIFRYAPLVLGVGVAGFASYKAYKVYRERHPRAALPAGDGQEQD